MALNKSYKELMELQGQSNPGGGSGGAATSNQMLDLILSRQPHSYDPKTDPAAQAARKTAAMNAKAVSRDVLGQHAGMTGGVPSTAAVSAAAQAGNQALAQGADRVAELERLSFQNYQTEGQNMMNAYAMMQQSEGDAWNRQMQEQQWAHQKEQDAYNRQWNEQMRAQEQAEADYQKKLAMAQLAASYGDLSGLKELGIDTSKHAAGGGSGGGGGPYYTPRNPESKETEPTGGLSDEDYNKLMMMADANRYLDEATFDQYAGIYGESALIAAGFKKKQAQRNPGSGNGGGSGSGGSNKGGTGGKKFAPIAHG